MSVSFFASVDGDFAIPSFVSCSCGESRSEMFASREAAYAAKAAGLFVSNCSDEYCLCDSLRVSDDEPEVRLSIFNASEMLETLGIQVGEDFEDCWSGSLPADDFKGRVLMALALVPTDEGMPAHLLTPEGSEGVQIWQAERPAGYAQSRLAQLLEVAEFALSQGREVAWG